MGAVEQTRDRFTLNIHDYCSMTNFKVILLSEHKFSFRQITNKKSLTLLIPPNPP